MVVEASQGGDEVFCCAAAASGVAAAQDVSPDVFGELFDLGCCRFVQAALAPVFADPFPVGAVHAAGSGADASETLVM